MNTHETMRTTPAMHPAEPATFLIGEVARRTGLSVSAIRYYADEGIVSASEITDAGHRRYDVEAVARLDLVRTLRDLGAGLEQVRRVLAGSTSLGDHLAEHLDVIERQATGFESLADLLAGALEDPEYIATQSRYLELVAAINEAPPPDTALAAGLQESGSSDGPALQEVGPWLAAALRASAGVPSR